MKFACVFILNIIITIAICYSTMNYTKKQYASLSEWQSLMANSNRIASKLNAAISDQEDELLKDDIKRLKLSNLATVERLEKVVDAVVAHEKLIDHLFVQDKQHTKSLNSLVMQRAFVPRQ